MISLLIFALIVLAIAGLGIWLVGKLPLPSPFNALAIFVICLIAILAIAQRAGVF